MWCCVVLNRAALRYVVVYCVACSVLGPLCPCEPAAMSDMILCACRVVCSIVSTLSLSGRVTREGACEGTPRRPDT